MHTKQYQLVCIPAGRSLLCILHTTQYAYYSLVRVVHHLCQHTLYAYVVEQLVLLLGVLLLQSSSSGLRDKNYQPLVNIQCHRNTLWTHVVRPPSVISILPIDSIDEPCSSSTRVCIQESYSSQEYNAYQSTIRSMDTHAYTCTMHSVVCIILCILLQSTSYAHTTVEQYVRARIQKQRQLPSLKHKYYQI